MPTKKRMAHFAKEVRSTVQVRPEWSATVDQVVDLAGQSGCNLCGQRISRFESQFSQDFFSGDSEELNGYAHVPRDENDLTYLQCM